MADISTAIAGFTEFLEKEFRCSVIDKDIQEDIPRPALVLQTTNITHDKIGALPHDNFDLEIYYFAPKKENGYAELYGVMKKMQDIFSEDYIAFADGYKIPVEATDYELNRRDMVLLTTLNIDMVHSYVEAGEYDMETLNNHLRI